MKPPFPRHAISDGYLLLQLLGTAVLYAALATAALSWFSGEGTFSVFWPASGLALAVVLVGGPRYAVGIFLGALLTNAISSKAGWSLLVFALGNTLEALMGCWLLNRKGPFLANDCSPRSYLRLTLQGGVPAVSISASAGTLTLLLLGQLNTGQFWPTLLYWGMGNLLGIVLVTPLILLWRRRSQAALSAWGTFEAALVIGASLVVGQAVFIGWFPDTLGLLARQGYWMFFFITWAAIRLGTRWVVLLLCCIAVQAMVGAHNGVGFFANSLARNRSAEVWFYMMSLSLVGMALSTYLAELRRAADELRIAAIAFDGQIGMFVMDANRTVIRINRAFSRITGFTAEDIVGRSPQTLLPGDPATQQGNDKAWAEVLRSGSAQREVLHRHKGGSDFPALASVTAVKNNQGSITHFVGTVASIVDAKRQEQQRLINEAAHRDALIREVHHRIKNNLQGIIGVLGQYARAHPETEEPIRQAIAQVQGISVIHGLRGRADPASVQLCELTSAIAAEVAALWQTPVRVDLPQPWAACTLAEQEAVPMALVLNELIQNAVKHGGKTHADTRVSLEKLDQPDQVLITIFNTGTLPVEPPERAPSHTGMKLVQSLLPRSGAQLHQRQCAHQVMTELRVAPPVIRLKKVIAT